VDSAIREVEVQIHADLNDEASICVPHGVLSCNTGEREPNVEGDVLKAFITLPIF